jgi:hypothetical protein
MKLSFITNSVSGFILIISFIFTGTLLIFPSFCFGNPFMVDSEILYDETSNWQSNSKVAFDGTNFLVVWQDLRKDGYSHIRGCRVSQNGQILDEGGFTISLTDCNCRNPAVVFDGTNYFVVWYNYLRWSPRGIRATRVTPAGTVLDTTPINITNDNGIEQTGFSVSSSGNNILVVWSLFRETTNHSRGVYGTLLSPQGTILDSIIVQDAFHVPKFPDVSFDGNNYLLVWQDCWLINASPDTLKYWIKGVRISESGILIDTIPLNFVTYDSTSVYVYRINRELHPSIVYGQNNYFLTWNSVTIFDNPDQNIYGTRITPSGTVLDPNYIPISTAVGNQNKSSVAFDGSEFLVTWMDFRWSPGGNEPTIYFTEVDTSGNVITPTGSPVIMSTQQREPSVCYGNGEFLVSFRDRRGNPFMYAYDDDIFVARIDDAGNPLDPQGISTSYSTQDQRMPAVGFDGTHHLIVWEDQRNSDTDLYGALIDSTGNLVIPPGVFAISDETEDQLLPAVEFVDPYYLVGWVDLRYGILTPGYFGTRITKEGTVLEPNGIDFNVYSDYCSVLPHISISNDGTNFAIVCSKFTNSSLMQGIIFRMDTAGTILDTNGIEIDTCIYPQIAFDGTNWMIAYLSWDWSGSSGVSSIRMSTSGSLIPPSIQVSDTSFISWSEPLSISYNGLNYLVAWAEFYPGYYSDIDIYGSQVSPNGYDIDTVDILISSAPNDQYEPRIASRGGYYFITWTDTRNYPDTLTDYTKQIYGTYVSPSGNVVYPNGIPLTPLLSENKSPSVVKSAGNKYLLCYSGFTEFPYGSYRIHGQFIDDLVGVEEPGKGRMFVNRLEKNYPNPFSQSTIMRYHICKKCHVNLSVYNSAGRLVKTLIKEEKQPGAYYIRWDGTDDNRMEAANGIYFYTLKADDFTVTRKMILIR